MGVEDWSGLDWHLLAGKPAWTWILPRVLAGLAIGGGLTFLVLYLLVL